MTLQEIAKRAHVSIATVSRKINSVPNVKPSLARRVRRVIEEFGYYPNTHARVPPVPTSIPSPWPSLFRLVPMLTA